MTSSRKDILLIYKAHFRKKLWVLFALSVLLLLLVFSAVSFGAYHISLGQILRTLAGMEQGSAKIVVWDIRMPRIVTAIVTGCALGISGMAIQTLLRNPLGSPFTLGISQGAAFGASFAIIVLGAGSVGLSSSASAADAMSNSLTLYATTGLAFLGAIAATMIVLLLARLRKMSPSSIILAGVALASLFTSGTILVQYFATEEQIAMAVFWTFGDVTRSGWTEVSVLGIATFFVMLYYFFFRWSFNALSIGQEACESLGVNVNRLRLWGMFLAALVAALATAFNGVIAFLGLLAPHMGRWLLGSDYRLLIPASALIGAVLLLAADTVGRLLLGSGTLPVGVLTSFMGAPLFLYLLIKGASRW